MLDKWRSGFFPIEPKSIFFTSRAESEECKIPPFEFEKPENILLLNKMYNFYVEEDAHLVVNGLTAGK